MTPSFTSCRVNKLNQGRAGRGITPFALLTTVRILGVHAAVCVVRTYPRARTVYLCVPLLAVQTHLEPLTDEERHPHDDVEHGALSLVIHHEVQHG